MTTKTHEITLHCTCRADVPAIRWAGGTCAKCGREWKWAEDDYYDTQRWIPCSERMPEHDKDVLCAYADGLGCIVGRTVAYRDGWLLPHGWDDEITHWMPLPPLPESKP